MSIILSLRHILPSVFIIRTTYLSKLGWFHKPWPKRRDPFEPRWSESKRGWTRRSEFENFRLLNEETLSSDQKSLHTTQTVEERLT